MKTNEEIETEARRLTMLGRQYRNEQQRTEANVAVVALPRVLVRLPESRVTLFHESEPELERVHTLLRERYIEAAVERGELVYRLMEKETETAGSGRVVHKDAPSLAMFSRSGRDLLRTGYELVEEERFGELLAPYAERSEDPHRADPADAQAVAEVEAILETNLLSLADRVRAKVEIVEFLEGRLEPSVFITRAIDRQCARESRHERLTERYEIKLTMGEP